MKVPGRQWQLPWDRVVIWRDTGVSEVKEARQNSCRQRNDLDSLDPRSTFGRTDVPPFPSHLGGVTEPADGGEQQGRDQRDAKDVKEHHTEPGNQGRKAGAGVYPSW